MLLVERMAMLGASIASVKATLKAIVGDDTKFGADAPAQELSLILLTAVWKSASVLQEHIGSSCWRTSCCSALSSSSRPWFSQVETPLSRIR